MKPYLDNNLVAPERRRGTAQFHDVDSFVRHALRFASAATAIFADPSNKSAPRFLSVIDYHPESDDAKKADWLQHRGNYQPALSEEWKVWSANNGKAMSQAEFASFIEDRIGDVVVASLDDERIQKFADLVQGRFALPTELHELSRGLAVNVGIAVRNAVTLSTGEITVQYDEQHRDGGGAPIKVPNLFQIVIPVFYAGVAYRISARLRYRVNDGKINWHYQLVRPDLVFDDAFNGIVELVKTGTSRPVFLGSPEA